MTAPIASGWSGCRMGFSPTGKRRLCTVHTRNRHGRQGLPIINFFLNVSNIDQCLRNPEEHAGSLTARIGFYR
jgi:hypothetical protein